MLDKNYEKIFRSFYDDKIKGNYYLFHFDERWNQFDKKIYGKVIFIIEKVSKKNKIIITVGLENFFLLKILEEKYNIYNFNNDKFSQHKLNKDSKNISLLKNLPLDLLAHFIRNSDKNFSAHSGPVIHIGAAFDRKTIDLIKKEKNDELDRWIPSVSNYQRVKNQ